MPEISGPGQPVGMVQAGWRPCVDVTCKLKFEARESMSRLDQQHNPDMARVREA